MAYTPKEDPELAALQALYSYGDKATDPNLKNEVLWKTNMRAGEKSDELDTQIKALEDGIKAMEESGSADPGMLRDMKAQLAALRGNKESLGRASSESFWGYRPAGWDYGAESPFNRGGLG